MSLLYPGALALAALAAVPLLVHLLRRDRAERVPFPALRYLERAERRHARALRLRHLALLAARLALVALLALAAAGPLVGRGGAADHPPTDVAVVVDNSASTARGARDTLVAAGLLRRAAAGLAAAGGADRFWILPTVGPPVALEAGAAEARAALARVPATDGAGDLTGTVSRALSALAARGGRAREVHLLTDAQAADWDGGPVPAGDGIPVVVGLLRPPAAANHAVVVETAGRRTTAGDPVSRVAGIRSFGGPGAPPDTAARDVRLRIDGRLEALARVRPGEPARLRAPAPAPGWHAVRIEIDPSGLGADDARHEGLHVAPPPRVTRSGAAGTWLGRALETLAAAGRIALDPGDGPEGAGGDGPAEGAAAGEVGRTRVHVVEAGDVDAPLPGPAQLEAVVLIPPPDPLALGRFHERLDALGADVRLTPDPAAGNLPLDSVSAAVLPGGEAVRVAGRYRLEPRGAPTDTLLRTGDGEPWLIRGEGPDGRWLLLASPLRPPWTTVPLRVAMLPLVERLVLRWSGAAGWPEAPLFAGRPVTLPARARAVVAPDGRERTVDGGAPWLPLRAGVYELRLQPGAEGADSGALSRPVGVDAPLAESDPAELDAEALRGRLPGREVTLVEDGDEAAWRAAVFRERRGRDLTPWLLPLLLAVVLAEAGLAASGRRDPTGSRRRGPTVSGRDAAPPRRGGGAFPREAGSR